GGEDPAEGGVCVARVGGDAEAHLRPFVAEAVERAHGDDDAIADAAHVDDDFLRALAQDAPVEMRDHEAVRVGWRWAWQRATARASTASPAACASRARMR